MEKNRAARETQSAVTLLLDILPGRLHQEGKIWAKISSRGAMQIAGDRCSSRGKEQQVPNLLGRGWCYLGGRQGCRCKRGKQRSYKVQGRMKDFVHSLCKIGSH